MDHSANTTADPAELARAQETWHFFTTVAKRATIAIIIGVILLAFITLGAP